MIISIKEKSTFSLNSPGVIAHNWQRRSCGQGLWKKHQNTRGTHCSWRYSLGRLTKKKKKKHGADFLHVTCAFNVYSGMMTDTFQQESTPSNPFGRQQLRAPFAARENQRTPRALVAKWMQKQGKEGAGKKSSSASADSWGLMAQLPEYQSRWVPGFRPLSQQGTKINEGSFRQLNKTAVKPNNKWALR